MRRILIATLVLFLAVNWIAAGLDAWCPHVTNTDGWKTSFALYNPGIAAVATTIQRYNAEGNPYVALLQITVPPMAWADVASADLAYNGTAHLTAASDLEVKLNYQFGESPSVCEFYLTGQKARGWMLPNTVRSWMNYTGVALMNPSSSPVSVILEAWSDGNRVASTSALVPARGQYLRLSDGVWDGMNYEGFDTIRIHCESEIPAPIDITGNYTGDRHLFFSGRPMPFTGGDLVETDSIVGNLRYVPAGTFVQGSPPDEPCRDSSEPDKEKQFTHILTKNLAVMETEVTRQMWASLKAVQPTLPADPSILVGNPGMTNPVQCVMWSEAVLFANLLSLQRGLTRCYYTDVGLSTPITSANYQTNTVYCNWNATGYRLPSEGEREYFCRAGTTMPFWIAEPNYTAGNCNSISTPGMYPQLETAAWFWGNSASIDAPSPVGIKAANPWNLKDVHGNVAEWCWDLYARVYPTGTVTDYRGASSGSNRVFRDVCWVSDAAGVRAAQRGDFSPSSIRISDLGFRLIKSLP